MIDAPPPLATCEGIKSVALQRSVYQKQGKKAFFWQWGRKSPSNFDGTWRANGLTVFLWACRPSCQKQQLWGLHAAVALPCCHGSCAALVRTVAETAAICSCKMLLPLLLCNSIYASPSSVEAYRDRRLTTNFELWVEIFCVPTCFHVRIPKPCLSVRTPRKEITLASSISVLH